MLTDYVVRHYFDEMMETKGVPRKHYDLFYTKINEMSAKELKERYDLAQSDFLFNGITFTVYSGNEGIERTIPFDFVPRIIPQDEWNELEVGLKQRIRALDAFLEDIYHDGHILKDGVVPRDLVVNCPHFFHQMVNTRFPRGKHIFMAGIDLIRDENGNYRVLEDNLRNPSGLSYVFQSRFVMRKTFPEFFQNYSVRPLEQQFSDLLASLQYFSPDGTIDPKVVLLTPGIYNSAYYDHMFLAQQMGIELVEGQDMLVSNRKVYMKTTKGLQQVDVIYRRIDDEFIDPLEFRGDSLLGVPGLMDAYRAGNVSVLNAIGNGVADDKAVYHYVPDMIRYYLNEEPLIQNVETYYLNDPDVRAYVLDHLDELVVKQKNGSGGYGMLIGPHAEPEEIEKFRQLIKQNPDTFIAQPTIKLSRSPSFQTDRFNSCHVDLRAFVFNGDEPKVFPGGLTRVALKKGSLVVNSSQGGGVKDTWVLHD
ncbi:MAG TPA: circularly permuted type 2 ATP-grasp protein [Bacillales bacterium]|nr:circularly permuted type 2 ATP-grasp protein [Bacillales bacterium]